MQDPFNSQGTAWATRFQAPNGSYAGATSGGRPLLPSEGGYARATQQPYNRAPALEVVPAGVGPIGGDRDGIDLSFFLAKPKYSGRSSVGNTFLQGARPQLFHVGVQGLDASARVYPPLKG